MKFQKRIKSVLLSLIVTAALVIPAVVLALTPGEVDAYLLFQMDGQNGSGLYTMDDGSMQARIAVVMHGGTQRSGASFILNYNPDYLTPSKTDNTPIDGKETGTDAFFTYNPALYGGVNPFAKEVDGSNPDFLGANYSQFIASESKLIMNLWLDRNLANESKDKVKKLDAYSFADRDVRYAFVDDKDITLGLLTFQVNPDRLTEIAQYFHNFGGGQMIEDPEVNADYPGDRAPDKTFLVKVPQTAYGDWGAIDPWSIGYYGGDNGKKTLKYYKQGTTEGVTGTVFYKNDVDPDTIISVRPAEDEVTVNAYQAYSNGDVDDLALVLRRYSPMATVTYIDGREENVVIPWGEDAGAYTVMQEDGVTQVTNENYDLTHGEYIITQRVPPHFPVPIQVRLHVTPITLQNIQVEDQTKTYLLREVVDTVKEPGDLALPDQARLVTDIVPGGVSMVMDIPGWVPEKGTWPRLAEGNTNASKLMNSLKEDSFDTTTKNENDPAAEPKWPDNDDINVIDDPSHFLGKYNDQWLGKYTFHMAESYGTAEDPKPAAKDHFTKAEIQAVYPWLTVPEEQYAVPTALRQIVTADNYTPANAYKVEYTSTVDETILGQTEPKLTLTVSRQNGQSMAETSIFRVWLPDGQELGTGLNTTVWPGPDATTVDNWFPEHTVEGGSSTYQNGYYKPEARTIVDVRSFDLTTNPGNPESHTYNNERETLRRYINLGGWFYVTVTEDPATHTWSDPMPVYVPPRTNEYTENKEYNFLGDNSNLFTWSGGLTHYVTLPRGTYNDVDATGQPLYLYNNAKVTVDGLPASQKDSYGRPNQFATRATAAYAYTTTYDGATGAQPGTLTTFQVDKANRPESEMPPARGDAWSYAATAGATGTIFTYGPDPFYDGAVYGGYGTVKQHREADNTIADPETVTVRRDSHRTVPGSQRITLTSVEPTGITRVVQDDLTSNVTQVTYNTKEEGYTARQSYTLTITNHGTEPIYGLAIDNLTDGYEKEPTGGRFIMEKAPADYLAPGGSTTFVLTYVFDLVANPSPDNPYHDILYITSSDHPTGGPDKREGTDYLLKFDAEVLVSSQPTHNVRVVVKPGDLSMGTAGLIIGQPGGVGDINYTPTARGYAYGAEVYVVVEPKDEYSIYEKPTAVDAQGYSHEVTVVPVPAGQKPVYKFFMPNYDTTVTVCFFEDTYSKLRLSDLIDFSGDKRTDLKQDETDTVADEDTYTVWRKSFTDADHAAAANWVATKANGAQEDLYLMTAGRPIPKKDGGNTFVPSENQYLVVIPYDAAYSQVEATLRALVTHNDYKGNGENKDITPTVTMHWFGKDILDTWTATSDGADIIYSGNGDTAVPTKHTSEIFNSPDPGTSNYVRITVEAPDAEHTQRLYYLEIHRRPEDPIATLHYGNSPYGMIMNAPNFQGENDQATANLRQVAKEAFRAGYTFKGLPQNYLPAVLQGISPVVDVSKVTYWREAWVNNTLPFEPESNTGYVLHEETITDPEGATSQVHSYIPNVNVYDERTNLDLNDYAYFATLGTNMMEPGLVEALDSSGRPVDLQKIMVSAEVTLLDTAQTTQVARFSGTETVTLDLGVANTVKVGLRPTATAATAASWPATSAVQTVTETVDGVEQTVEKTVYTPVHNIRPGQYILTYTYPDFDGGSLSVTRPFVILPRTGDVNVDGYLNSTRSLPDGATEDAKKSTDEYVLENRVADLLGYEAGKWEQVDGAWTETVYPRANIFKYRVCDVNNDRNVNNIDGNEINRLARDPDGLHPLKFYEPVNYGHPNYTPPIPTP